MASRKKKTSKGKREAAFSLGASSEAAGKNKGVVRILIMVVLVVGVFEAINLLRTGDTPKDFKVQTIQKVVGEEKPCGHFTAWGIAPVGKDKVLVTDQENSRLLEFDRKGNFLKSWGKKGTGLKNFMEPSGMTSDNSGNAYVMDTWNGFIKGYDENGTQTLTIDLTKFKNFYGPRGIAFDGHNFVVADTGNHRIAIVSPENNLVMSWGKMGTGSGDVKGPLAVASDGNGNYFIADTDNNRMQWLNQDGKVLKIYKYVGGVTAVAADKEGRFYVANADEGGCVKVYSPKGNYLGDLRDESGSGTPFAGVRSMSISSDNMLMLTAGSTASWFQLPTQNP